MTAFRFARDGGQSQEAWRALDRAVYRWVLAHGGSPLLAATAAWASLADGFGDAALPLAAAGAHGSPALAREEIERLRAEAMVAGGGAGAPRPFVLDEADRFYLWRNHADECAAAAAILQRRAARGGPTPVDAELDALFPGAAGATIDAQRAAVRAVVGRRLFVLTGAPGTGKTTTVLRMLLMLQRRAPAPLAIRIAAPTGKAAQRLLHALRRGKALLRDADPPLAPEWRALLDALPDGEALTVHRLLDFQPWRNAFARGATDPVLADVVVVDEASMLDLSMLRTLLEAVRADATLVLVGDADQLTSVATGSVLMDIVGALESDARAVVRLRHSFRAQPDLVALNDAVRRGDAAALHEAAAARRGLALRATQTPRQLDERIAQFAAALAAETGLRPMLPADADADSAAARALRVQAAFGVLAHRQLLCALRETPFGSVAVNAAIERALRRAWELPAGAEWYAGRAVIVTRNDYGAGLFNGDIGLCLADADGRLRVWFEGAGADGAVRGFAPSALPEHETAFAITIHKSQGSEYEHVAVLLPAEPENRILSRQLLYTAVSRARRSVELWASDAALAAALAHPIERQGGLRERLLAGAPPARRRPARSAAPDADAAPGPQLGFEF